ncbi:MAG: serine hydrolase [Pirellulales bacterium]
MSIVARVISPYVRAAVVVALVAFGVAAFGAASCRGAEADATPVAARVFPGRNWERREPADVSLDADKLAEFRDIVGGASTASRGCIVRRGYLVYSWGDYDKPRDVASALKPFYSYLMMQALASGKLVSLDARVSDYWKDDPRVLGRMDHKDRGLTFRHLGFQTACLGYEEPPGAAFDYNDASMGFFWDTLINRVYGVAWKDAEAKVIRPLLAEPLAFEDGTPGVVQRNTGRFQVSARDFCRFGLLMLHSGNWAGKQLLREDLATMAVTDPLPLSIPRTAGKQADTVFPVRSIGGGGNQCDHNGGYSWMWWLNRRARDGKLWFPDVSDDFFACFGHGGQEGMAVLPGEEIVVSWIGNELHQDRERGNRAFRTLAAAVTEKSKTSRRPMRGQIVVDPDHPSRLAYHDTWIDDAATPGGKRLRPCFLVGPGDPEDLLWNDTRANVDLLKQRRARCTYITAELSDFGGGSLPRGEAMDAKIAEWNRTICELEAAGVATVFFFLDDGARRDDWPDFVDRIVARLKYHRLLVWCVAEEYGELGSDARELAGKIAERIRDRDQFGHVVGIHQNHGAMFDFAGDKRFDMFLMQYNVDSAEKLHAGCVEAWRSTGGRQVLNMSECVDHGQRGDDDVRQMNWASVMGGASAVQVLWMGRASDPAAWNTAKRYDDCATLADFFESIDANALAPADDLAFAGTQYVLAGSGQRYVAYARDAKEKLGLRGLPAGRFALTWIGCDGGRRVEQPNVTVVVGDSAWRVPPELKGEVAVYVRRVAKHD